MKTSIVQNNNNILYWWELDNNTNILIRKDPGIGSRDSHILSEHLIQTLNDQGYFYLHRV